MLAVSIAIPVCVLPSPVPAEIVVGLWRILGPDRAVFRAESCFPFPIDFQE